MRTAGKMDDFLMNPKSRPDLQTPYWQAILKALKHSFHNERTDELMPWMVREIKKGRIRPRAPAIKHSYDPMYDSPPYDLRPADILHPEQMAKLEEAHDPEFVDNLVTRLLRETPPGHLFEAEPSPVQREADNFLIGEDSDPIYNPFSPLNLDRMADWYHDKNHPTRRGVDVMKLNVNEMKNKVNEYHDQLAEAARDKALKGGKVVHEWPDGWTLRNLTEPGELKGEGEVMGHCVGGYDDEVRNGRSIIYSLRDPEHKPHVTMEFQPTEWHDKDLLSMALESTRMGQAISKGTPDLAKALRQYEDWHVGGGHEGDLYGEPEPTYPGADLPELYKALIDSAPDIGDPKVERSHITQIQGKSDKQPKPEYQQRLKSWFQTFAPEDSPQWEETGEDIRHIHDIDPDAPNWDIGNNHVYGDDHGYGAHGDYGIPDNRKVDWDWLTGSVIRPKSYSDDYHGERSYDPKEGQKIYDLAVERGQIPEFAKAVEAHDQQQLENFDNQQDMNHEYLEAPYPGDDPEAYLSQDAYDRAMKAYEEENGRAADAHPGIQSSNHLHSLISPHWHPATDNSGYGGYRNEIYQKPSTFSKTAKQFAPDRYLWAFSSQTGQVHLSHEWEGHPADAKDHETMAHEIGETGLTHGYAYPIGGGWRIFNYELQPVGDRYIIKRVVEALSKELSSTHTSMAADPNWLKNWIGRNGPYLYHSTESKNIPSILKNGILPDQVVHRYDDGSVDDWQPRPGHTYLKHHPSPPAGSHVRVDLRKLSPENLNPDEDAVYWDQEEGIRDWDAPYHHQTEDGMTRGEWAQKHDFSSPAMTGMSLEDYTTIAHRGPIPPEAIDMSAARVPSHG